MKYARISDSPIISYIKDGSLKCNKDCLIYQECDGLAVPAGVPPLHGHHDGAGHLPCYMSQVISTQRNENLIVAIVRYRLKIRLEQLSVFLNFQFMKDTKKEPAVAAICSKTNQ